MTRTERIRHVGIAHRDVEFDRGVLHRIEDRDVVGGIFRIVGASVLKFPSWGWAVLSGIVSLVLGVMVLAYMPLMSVFFLGIVVGANLLTDGIAFVALGTQLHSIPKIEPYKESKAA